MNLYMDESGSVHPGSNRLNRFFIIGIILPENEKSLRRAYKIFIRKNFTKLKKLDQDNRMFDKNGKFRELKGSCLNREMKVDFMHFFCQKNAFKVGYIVLDNNQLQEKFIANKARTFNYLLKLFLTSVVQKGYLKSDQLFLQIDERNVRTDSRFSLEDYLNQEMVLNLGMIENVKVQYFDSARNQMIQVADVFSNILYSNMVTKGKYNREIRKLMQKGYILPLFRFPLKKDKNNPKII